jgi:hypothetical protein
MTQVKKIFTMIILVILTANLMTGVAMASEKAWADWPDTDIAAGFWVKEKGYFGGYTDGTFKPNLPINSVHFWSVLNRAGIKNASANSNPATIADAQRYLPNAAVTSKPTDTLTRYRMAAMLYRNFVTPVSPDLVVIDKLEKLFLEKKVTWNGVTRTSKLVGHAKEIVDFSRNTGVPIWLALGQCWRESQWFTTGLSVNYNCGWGIKDGKGTWGILGSPNNVSGYSNYASISEAIAAYFRLMSSPNRPYKALIDAGDDESIRKALNIYAPAFENDTNQHWVIVKAVRGWLETRGIK